MYKLAKMPYVNGNVDNFCLSLCKDWLALMKHMGKPTEEAPWDSEYLIHKECFTLYLYADRLTLTELVTNYSALMCALNTYYYVRRENVKN